MLTIHVWPRRLKEFLLTHPLYKSPSRRIVSEHVTAPRPADRKKPGNGIARRE